MYGGPPGERLDSQPDLAERLNVSRGTVRKALRDLESMNKVKIRRNAETFIAERQLGQPPVIEQSAEAAREPFGVRGRAGGLANRNADLSEATAVLDSTTKTWPTGKAPGIVEPHSGTRCFTRAPARAHPRCTENDDAHGAEENHAGTWGAGRAPVPGLSPREVRPPPEARLDP